MKGWERFDELSRKGGVGTRAFIAMQFGDAELNEVLENHLRPAVKRTGFDLMKLDDEPRAGGAGGDPALARAGRPGGG